MRRGSSTKLWSFRPSVPSFVGPISRVGLSRSYVAQRPVPSSSSMCAPAACIVSPSRCFSDQAPRSGSKDTEKKAESTATPEKHKKEHLSQVWSEKFNTFVQELRQSNQQQMGSDQRKKLQEEMGFFLRKFSKLRLVPLLDRAVQMGVTDKDLTPYLHPRVVADAYSGLGQHGKALDLLKPLLSGQQPTVADYDVAIKICGGIEDHGKAMTLWDDLLAKGLEPTVSTYTSILSCCSTPAHVETTALRVRKEMRARNLTPTSSYYYQLIRAYHKANIPHKVISTFHTMESKDKIVPDPYITTFALMAYGKEKRLDLVKSTMAQLKEKGFVPPTSTYNAYLLAAAYAGDYDHALDMLRNMEKYPDDYATPDSSTYDSLITACGEAGHLEKAWAVLKRMNKNGFRPSRRTMQNFVSICLAHNRKEQLLEVLRLMKKLEIAWESHTYNALITFYANNDDLESALKVLENMKRNASENLAGRRVVVAVRLSSLVFFPRLFFAFSLSLSLSLSLFFFDLPNNPTKHTIQRKMTEI
ncbi:Mitochondrial group I intron splicing factor ccm1, variant 2 [Balamuthia mandrillaris]